MRTNLVIGAAVIMALGWLMWPSGAMDSSRNALLQRVWIDRLPEVPTDKVEVFLMVDEIGGFQRTSLYEGDYTLFRWDNLRAREVDITMLQTDTRHTVRYHVSSRDCGGFDYCLELDGAPRGATRYYSMEEWVVDGSAPPRTLDLAALERILGASARAPTP